VLIGGSPAARFGDSTSHGGFIVIGCPTVLIGKPGAKTDSRCPGVPAAKADEGIKKALDEQAKLLEKRRAELERWNADDKARFKKWFGSDGADSKAAILGRIDKMQALNKSTGLHNFFPAQPPDDQASDLFAYVYPNDASRIYLGLAFCASSLSGADSKPGTLCHEMSHLDEIGGTDDVPMPGTGGLKAYGQTNSLALAKQDPSLALQNADNFQYFCEGL